MIYRRLLIAGGVVPIALLVFALAPSRANPPAQLAVVDKELASLGQLSEAFVNVAEKVTPAVVQIVVTESIAIESPQRRGPQFFDNSEEFRDFLRQFGFEHPEVPVEPSEPREYLKQGIGSGVVVDARNGYILTNSHVVKSARKIKVVLSDRRELKAELVGADETIDIAVIQVEPERLTAAALGNSEDLKMGEIVMAVGSPLGFGGSVTHGIVSGKGRDTGMMGQGGIESFIQTDAAVNQGNSGGPLVNLRGEVVGINTAIVSWTGLFAGVSFAVPIDLARDAMHDLISEGRVIRGYIGASISSLSDKEARYYELESPHGALVQEVVGGAPAEKAGLRRGDLILELNGEKVLDSKWFVLNVSALEPGDKVKLTILRNNETKKLKAVLTERPSADEIAEPPEQRWLRIREGLEEPEDETELPKIGVTVKPIAPTDSEYLRMEGIEEEDHGLLITKVKSGSAAAYEGLAPGMRITHVGGERVSNAEEIKEAVRQELDEHGMVLLSISLGNEKGFRILEPEEEE